MLILRPEEVEGQIVTGQASGRGAPTEITVFKNNGGQGIAELAIADLILSKAREKRLGMEVNIRD